MKDDYEGFAKVGVGEGITKEWTEEYDGLISNGWEDYLSDERPDI